MSARALPISTSPIALLSRLLAKLDLTPTQRDDLKRSYGAVTEALLKSKTLEGILDKLELRPQGSVRAGTVVKPSPDVNFDLDVLCWMVFLRTGQTPAQVWKLIWDALGEHGTYASMREPKPRCIRLQFAAGYHLDITPAIPDPHRPAPVVWVPDTKLQAWSPSNPIGFCDSWLHVIAAQLPTTIVTFSAESVLKGERAAAASNRQDKVEPLPDEEGFRKAPLLKLIQLVKYFRDQAYEEDDKDKPSSILLTTITARAYEKHLFSGHTSLNQFVVAVVSAIKAQVHVEYHHNTFKCSVMNPVDERENFADKWTLQTYSAFSRWADTLSSKMAAVMKSEAQGMDERLRVFNTSIPGAATFGIEKDIAADFRRHHDSGSLRLQAVPAVATSLVGIRPTTFFGNP